MENSTNGRKTMASPLTSQDFAKMDEDFINITVHFEGRDRACEFPSNLDDKLMFSLIIQEVAEMDGKLQNDESESNYEEEYSLFSVSGSHLTTSIVERSRSPLTHITIRSVVLSDGMLLASRRNINSQNADADLLSNGGMKLTVDVTPSCSILLNGGVDYDLSTALAELIDNAIAALLPNCNSKEVGDGGSTTLEESHVISVEISPSKWLEDGKAEGPILTVCDTGKGMNLHELRAWATLGDVTQDTSLVVVDDNTASTGNKQDNASCKPGGEKFLIGSLGRYGVGGKHAAFQLASSVTVATRQRGAPFVFEATLDAQLLSGVTDSDSNSHSMHRTGKGGRYGKGGKGRGKNKFNNVNSKQHRWVAELRVRAATQEEALFTETHSSWTKLELRRLKSGFVGLIDSTKVISGDGSDKTRVAPDSDGNAVTKYVWAESGVVQRSLSNLFYFYLFQDPLPIFHTEGSLISVASPSANGGFRRGACLAKRRIRRRIEEGDDTELDTQQLDTPSSFITTQHRLFNIKLVVGGSLLTPVNSDFAQIWNSAATELKVELKVQPEGSPPAFATMYLLYFPFIGEKETLPSLTRSRSVSKVPGHRGKYSKTKKNATCIENNIDDGLDNRGGICDNLVHVLWMGRYLPRGLGGRDERLKWMKPRKDQASATPDRAWRRVRTFLFLGPEFEADRTKQSLVSGASYTRALLSQSDKSLQDRYCSWVSNAHKELDEELWFDDPLPTDPSIAHHHKKIIEYRHLFVGGTRYNVNDRVEVLPIRSVGLASAPKSGGATASSNKVFGTLRAMYEIIDSSTREKIAMIDIIPLKEISLLQQHSEQNNDNIKNGEHGISSTAESYLASNLCRKIEINEWNKKQKLLLNIKPSRIDWVECKIYKGVSSIKGSRPPLEPISVGSVNIPHYRIAISILSQEGKPLFKQTSGASITMLGKHVESGYEWSCSLSSENAGMELSQYGQYIFNLLPPSPSHAFTAPLPSSLISSSSSSDDNSESSPSSHIGAGYFIKSGTYMYKWRCIELPLPSKEFTVTVLPGKPCEMKLDTHEGDALQRSWQTETCLRQQSYNSIFNHHSTGQNYNKDIVYDESILIGNSSKYAIPCNIDKPVVEDGGLSIIALDKFGNEVNWNNFQSDEDTSLSRAFQLRQTLHLEKTSHLRLRSKWITGSNTSSSNPTSSNITRTELINESKQPESHVKEAKKKNLLELKFSGLLQTKAPSTLSIPSSSSSSAILLSPLSLKKLEEFSENRLFKNEGNRGSFEEIVKVKITTEIVLNRNNKLEFESIEKNNLILFFKISAGDVTNIIYLPNPPQYPEPPVFISNKSFLPPLRFILHDICGNRILSPLLLEKITLKCQCQDNKVLNLRPGMKLSSATSSSTEGSWCDLGAVLIESNWGKVNIQKSTLGQYNQRMEDKEEENSSNNTVTINVTCSSDISGLSADEMCIGYDINEDKTGSIDDIIEWSHILSVATSNEPFKFDLGKKIGTEEDSNSNMSWLSDFFLGPRPETAYHNESCLFDDKLPLLSCHAGYIVNNMVIKIYDENNEIWTPSSSGYQVALYLVYPRNSTVEGESSHVESSLERNAGGDMEEEDRYLMSSVLLKSNISTSNGITLPDWEAPCKASMCQLVIKLYSPSPSQPVSKTPYKKSTSLVNTLSPEDREDEDCDEILTNEENVVIEFIANLEVLPSQPYKLRLQKLDPDFNTSSSLNKSSQVKPSRSSSQVPELRCGDEVILVVNVEDEFRNPIYRSQFKHFSHFSHEPDNHRQAESSERSLNHWSLPMKHYEDPSNSVSLGFNKIDLYKIDPLLFIKSVNEAPTSTANIVINTNTVGVGVKNCNTLHIDASTTSSHHGGSAQLVFRNLVETAFGWDLHNVKLGGKVDLDDVNYFKVIIRDGSNKLKASNILVSFIHGYTHRIEVNKHTVWCETDMLHMINKGNNNVSNNNVNNDEAVVQVQGDPARSKKSYEVSEDEEEGSLFSESFSIKNGEMLPDLIIEAFDQYENSILTSSSLKKKNQRSNTQQKHDISVSLNINNIAEKSTSTEVIKLVSQKSDLLTNDDGSLCFQGYDRMKGISVLTDVAVISPEGFLNLSDYSRNTTQELKLCLYGFPMSPNTLKYCHKLDSRNKSLNNKEDVSTKQHCSTRRAFYSKLCEDPSSSASSSNRNKNNQSTNKHHVDISFPLSILPGSHPTNIIIEQMNEIRTETDDLQQNNARENDDPENKERIWLKINKETTIQLTAGDLFPKFRFQIKSENGDDLTCDYDNYDIRVELMETKSSDKSSSSLEYTSITKTHEFPVKVLIPTPVHMGLPYSDIAVSADDGAIVDSDEHNSLYLMVSDRKNPVLKSGNYYLNIVLVPKLSNSSSNQSSILMNNELHLKVKLSIKHDKPFEITLLSPSYLPNSTILLEKGQLTNDRDVTYQVTDKFNNICTSINSQFIMKMKMVDENEQNGENMPCVTKSASSSNKNSDTEQSTLTQYSMKGRRVYLFPNNKTEVVTSAEKGIIRFHQVELLNIEMRDKLCYPKQEESWWKAQKYSISVKSKPSSTSKTETPSSSSKTLNSKEVGHDKILDKNCDDLEHIYNMFVVDVQPDEISNEEVILIDKLKLLAETKSALEEKEANLLKTREETQNEYSLRKEQLRCYDNELQTLRIQIDDSLLRLNVISHYKSGAGVEHCIASNEAASHTEDVPSLHFHHNHKEIVFEKLQQLTSTETQRRITCLGAGSKNDLLLRDMIDKVKQFMTDDIIRKQRSRIKPNDNSGDNQSLAKVEEVVYGLLGDLACLPSKENGLSHSIAAQLGQHRLSSLVTSHSKYYDDIQEIFNTSSTSTNTSIKSINPLSIIALGELLKYNNYDFLDKSGNESSSSSIVAFYDDTRRDVNNNEEAIDVPNGDILRNRLVAEFDMLMGYEKLINIPLPDLGMTLEELETQYHFRGYAVNFLQFKPSDHTLSLFGHHQQQASASPSLNISSSPSLRRNLWLPLLGLTMVVDSLSDAQKIRQAIHERTIMSEGRIRRGIVPICCRDGSRLDEFGFCFPPPKQLPSSSCSIAKVASLETSNKNKHHTSGKRNIKGNYVDSIVCFGEVTLEKDVEYIQVNILNDIITMYEQKKELRKDFYNKYYIISKDKMNLYKSNTIDNEVGSGGEGGETDSDIFEVMALRRKVDILNGEIKELRSTNPQKIPSSSICRSPDSSHSEVEEANSDSLGNLHVDDIEGETEETELFDHGYVEDVDIDDSLASGDETLEKQDETAARKDILLTNDEGKHNHTPIVNSILIPSNTVNTSQPNESILPRDTVIPKRVPLHTRPINSEHMITRPNKNCTSRSTSSSQSQKNRSKVKRFISPIRTGSQLNTQGTLSSQKRMTKKSSSLSQHGKFKVKNAEKDSRQKRPRI